MTPRASAELTHSGELSQEAPALERIDAQLEHGPVAAPLRRQHGAVLQQEDPADLEISKGDWPDPVIAGEELFYQLNVYNNGPDDATNVVVTDTLPLEVEYLDDTGNCTLSPATGPGGEDQLFCDLGDLGDGDSRTLEIKTRVPPETVRTELDGTISVTNTAAVSAAQSDPEPDNNSVVQRTFVQDSADLRIVKLSKPDTEVLAGEQFTYTILVDNLGPSTARNLVITDTLVTEDFVDANGCSIAVRTEGGGIDEFSCNFALATGVFDLGTFGSNWLNPRSPTDQGRIIITINATADESGDVNNVVTVTSDTPDPDMGNNIYQDELTIVDPPDWADLRVIKVSKPDTEVRAGEQFTYTILVDNLGPARANNIVITDTLITEGFVDANGCSIAVRTDGGAIDEFICNLAASTGIFDLGTFGSNWLNPRSTTDMGRIIITINATADDGGDVNNVVTVTSDTPDPDMDNNVYQDFLSILDTADLAITDPDDPDPVSAGDQLTYTIAITNTGPSAADNVVVEDNLPAEVEVESVAASGGASCAAGTPGDPSDPTTCNFGPLSRGESQTMTVLVRVKPDAVTDPVTDQKLIHNDVWVYSDTLDPDNRDNLDHETTTVEAQADLELSKFAVGTPRAGGVMHYEYQVENLGPSVSRDVTLRDFLPNEVEFLQAFVDAEGAEGGVPLPCDTTIGSNALFCPLGDIAPTNGVPLFVFVDVRIRSDVPDSTVITNNADVFLTDTPDPDPGNNSDTAAVTVLTTADVYITKSSNPEKVYAGQQKAYEITVGNLGPSDAQAVTVYDILPDGVTYEVDTAPYGCTQPGNLVGWQAELSGDNEVPPVATAASGLATFVLDTATNELAYSVNLQNIDNLEGAAGIHIHEAPAGVNGPVVVPLYDGSAPAPSPTQPLVGSVAIAPALATEIMANPAGYYVNVHTTDYPAGEIRGQLTTTENAPLKCELGTLRPGQTREFKIYALVDAGVEPGSTITNVAMVTSETTLGDPDLTNNEDKSRNLVLQMADLRIVKIVSPHTPVRAGEQFTYTILVDNLGPSRANNVVITDTLVTSAFVNVNGCSISVRTDGGAIDEFSCNFALSTGVFDLGTFGANWLNPRSPTDMGRVQITINATAEEATDLTDVSTVTSEAYDPDMSNNISSVAHSVMAVSDLSVTKTAMGQIVVGCGTTDLASDEATAGLLVAYQMIVMNDGPSTAENVLLLDRLPPGVVLIDADAPDGGECATGTPGDPIDQLTCGLGTMAEGEQKTVNVTVRVDEGLPEGTILENDVIVTSDIFDPDNDDNHAHKLTEIDAWADLSVAKTFEPPIVTAGELLEYTVEVRNHGPSDAIDVIVEDVLPDDPITPFLDVTYVGMRDPWSLGITCSLNPIDERTLTCALGDMAVDEVKLFTIVVEVNPNAPAVLDNTVQVWSEVPDQCPDNNEDNTGTPVDREDQLYVVKTDVPDPVLAGNELTYTVVFGNNGPSTATAVDVFDTLPLGVTFDRCESLDPNDSVTCNVIAGDGNTTRQVVRLEELLIANNVAFRYGDAPNDELDPGESYSFRLIADVESGYVLNGRGETTAQDICRPFFLASGYPYFAHNRIDITSDVDSDFDDECTRVDAEADIELTKVDDLAGFLECDPVEPGGTIYYDLTIMNHGPSDAAQLYLIDWLPREGVAHWPETVEIDVSRGEVLQVRDDGRITILVGNDPNHLGNSQPGRMNAVLGPVHVQIRVKVAETAECSSTVENQAWVEARRNDALWPPIPDAAFAPTPTSDPVPGNAVAAEETTIECPGIEVDKTVSFTGECPGSSYPVVAIPGKAVTFCFEITNTGTTYLDNIQLVDRLRTRIGERVVYTETITFGADENLPVAPGETVHSRVTVPRFCHGETCECGTVDNLVTVTAEPVNRGRTRYPCLSEVSSTDSAHIDVECAGVGTRLAVPALATEGLPAPPPSPFSAGDQTNQVAPATNCESWVQVQNVGERPTKVMIVLWGEAGYCPPQAAGPLKVECSGLLRPGSSWSFAPGLLPNGAQSGIVYSLSAEIIDGLPFGRLVCDEMFYGVVGDDIEWAKFDAAYRERRPWEGFDFGRYQGEPVALIVNRTCPDPADPNATGSAAYRGISADLLGAADPYMGGYMYYAPMVFADKGSLNSWLHIQNVGFECSSVEVWFRAQDNCLRAVLGDVLSVSPGETIHFDPNTVVGPDWLGSAWIRASQPLAIVVDTFGPNHFTSYTAVPADVYSEEPDATFSVGTQVNYAPMIYNEHQGWDTALVVQNLSSTTSAKAKVYFLDRSGGIVHTMVDWICPRGSQTFFLPVIDGLPGNWVGSARVESQEWWTPGDPLVDPPRLQSVVLLEKWSDPARTERREAVAYNAATECDVYNWQLGAFHGGTQSGSAVLAIPLLAKENRGISTELAITNLVPKPGKTDFAIFIYDQNGLLDYVCESLNEKQVEYIELTSWGFINPNFLGSAVVSAVFWEHDVFDGTGGFTRNLVGLGGVTVERVGRIQGAPDVPGDESKAVGMFPVFDRFLNERETNCPGVPPMITP